MEFTETSASRYRWPVTIIILALIVLAGFIFFIRSCSRPFTDERLTQKFISEIPEIHSTGGGNLEVATATATETFQRSDEKYAGWGWIYLGETVSEIRLPVTYRYHLQLSDPWKLQVSGPTCIVLAPRIRPSLPPAIHTDRMEKKSASGWARFDKQEQLDALERSMTPTLEQWVSDSRHINLAREESRKTVAEFVKTFLLREDQWRTDRFHSIKVVFEDEPSSSVHTLAPSIELTHQ